jgi:nitrate reductase assembly molybdenum cofactor insertion protein NarJ
VNLKTTLNMAYHQWGNSGKSPGLARLEQIYRQAGYERMAELPIFALMLEFLSTNPEASGSIRAVSLGFERFQLNSGNDRCMQRCSISGLHLGRSG